MANTELQFEMARRDQIIHNQREAQRNLWNLLMGLGLDEKQILDLAAKQGITIEDWKHNNKVCSLVFSINLLLFSQTLHLFPVTQNIMRQNLYSKIPDGRMSRSQDSFKGAILGHGRPRLPTNGFLGFIPSEQGTRSSNHIVKNHNPADHPSFSRIPSYTSQSLQI